MKLADERADYTPITRNHRSRIAYQCEITFRALEILAVVRVRWHFGLLVISNPLVLLDPTLRLLRTRCLR